jgi:short-subunit dehydrogenase
MLFTIGLRDELANTGVRVQLVLPASTDLDRCSHSREGVDDPDFAEKILTEVRKRIDQ